jgi:hypothetical protein
MSLTLDRLRIQKLRTFVDDRVRRRGCDHSHRFARAWAKHAAIDWDDLLDILEVQGAFCDCEVVLNMPEGVDLQTPAATLPAAPANPWLIPPGFECDPARKFQKVIVCQTQLARKTYASDGEILVPAPKGAKPRRRMRKSVNFFVGCRSGMPTEVGVVHECGEITSPEFAGQVAESGIEELARFGVSEAAFVLSKVALVPASKPVGTYFADRVGIASRHEELTVHRVLVK